jgi:hypothetical protein
VRSAGRTRAALKLRAINVGQFAEQGSHDAPHRRPNENALARALSSLLIKPDVCCLSAQAFALSAHTDAVAPKQVTAALTPPN